jgi:hypothetical protein
MGRLLLALAILACLLAIVLNQLRTAGSAGLEAAMPQAQLEQVAPPATELASVSATTFDTRKTAPVAHVTSGATSLETMTALFGVTVNRESVGAEEGTVELIGHFDVLDRDGKVHPAEDGKFTLVKWRESSGLHDEVEVRQGSWRVRVPMEARLGYVEIELGGRPACLETGCDTQIDIPASGRIALVVRWLPSTLLHVRNAQSRLELDGVETFKSSDWMTNFDAHPGLVRKEDVQSLGPSPVILGPRLTSSQSRRTLFVRAQGHAWNKVEIDDALGGDRIVDLSPAGSLDLSLTAPDGIIPPGLQLRLRPAEDLSGRTTLSVPFDAQFSFAFDSIAAGSYVASAELGERWDAVMRASAPVEVLAGHRTQVLLELQSEPEVEKARMAGTLHVPRELQLENPRLTLKLLDTPVLGQDSYQSLQLTASASRDGGLWSWSAAGLQTGRYQIWMMELEWGVVVNLPETGLTDVHLELPLPAQVRVTTSDADTGLPVEVDEVLWYCRWPEGVNGSGLEDAKRAARDLWTLRAPRTTVVLHVWDPQFEFVEQEVDLTAGDADVSLSLRRACGLVLSLLDGTTVLPWTDEFAAEFEPVDHDGRATWSGRGPNLRQGVSAPGLYRVQVTAIPGYLPIEPFELQIPAGQWLEHTVKLQRR